MCVTSIRDVPQNHPFAEWNKQHIFIAVKIIPPKLCCSIYATHVLYCLNFSTKILRVNLAALYYCSNFIISIHVKLGPGIQVFLLSLYATKSILCHCYFFFSLSLSQRESLITWCISCYRYPSIFIFFVCLIFFCVWYPS